MRYQVQIVFENSTYEANVECDNEARAYQLAFIDARMLHGQGAHYGRVVKQTTMEVEDGSMPICS